MSDRFRRSFQPDTYRSVKFNLAIVPIFARQDRLRNRVDLTRAERRRESTTSTACQPACLAQPQYLKACPFRWKDCGTMAYVLSGVHRHSVTVSTFETQPDACYTSSHATVGVVSQLAPSASSTMKHSTSDSPENKQNNRGGVVYPAAWGIFSVIIVHSIASSGGPCITPSRCSLVPAAAPPIRWRENAIKCSAAQNCSWRPARPVACLRLLSPAGWEKTRPRKVNAFSRWLFAD